MVTDGEYILVLSTGVRFPLEATDIPDERFFLKLPEFAERNRECVRCAEGKNILPVIEQETSLKLLAAMPGQTFEAAAIVPFDGAVAIPHI